jgi:type I restriction enzyme S subunit
MSSDALAIAELHAEVHTADASPRLPEGWAWASLGEILPLEYGKALPERLRDPTGKVAVYGSSGRVGWHTAAMIAGPTLIVGRKGSAGAVFYCNEDCWPIDTVYYTKPKGIIDLRYGFHFLKWRALGRLDQSTAIPSLSRDIYSDVAMPVAPLPEQRRIVVRIDELFAEIAEGEAALERARQGLDTWRRALLKAAVTGELTRDWREANRPAETAADLLARIRADASTPRSGQRRRATTPEPLDTTSLPELPKGWAWARLADVIVAGPTNGYSPKKSKDGAGSLALKLTATTRGSIELSARAIKRLSETIQEESDLFLKPGDLLFQRGNTIQYVGIAAVYEGPERTYIYPDLMIRVRTSDQMLTRWIWRVANSHLGRKYMQDNATGTAGTMPKINGEILRNLALPLPPHAEIIETLRLVAEGIEAIADFEEQAASYQKAVNALRQSILKSAFEGRLVPQDPADAPISALLAQLRNGHPTNGVRRRRARATADFAHPSLPGLTRQSVDPRVEPAGDE